MKCRISLLVVLLALLICPAFAYLPQYGSLNNTHWDYFPASTHNTTDLNINITRPSQSECNTLCVHAGLVSSQSTFYWTSADDETTLGTAYLQNFGDYVEEAWGKNYGLFVCRCAVEPGAKSLLAKVYFNNSLFPVPVADFNASPTSGVGPLNVAFTDNSTTDYSIISSNWSSSPAGYFDTPLAEDTNGYFIANGNYTITHCIQTGSGSDCETKPDYIWVYNSTTLVQTGFKAIDGHTGYGVSGAQVDLKDVENNSWTNTTTVEGFAYISTLEGHTIDAYASASGYDDADLLAQPAVHMKLYNILMFGHNVTNVTAGNVTLYVYVRDYDTLAPISGAGVTANYGLPIDFTLLTNDAGVAAFVVPNNTVIRVSATKAGYNSITHNVNSGTGSGGDDYVTDTVLLTKKTVTPTVTATTGPGGTVPTTIDPRTDAEKQSDMASLLIDNGEMLLNLFILLTIFGGLKMFMKW